MKTTQRIDGTPFDVPNGKPHMFVCCDCALAHDVLLVGRTGRPLKMTVWRNARSTAQRRRALKRRKGGVFA